MARAVLAVANITSFVRNGADRAARAIDQAIDFLLPDSEGRHKLARLYGKGARLEDGTLAHVVERTAGVSVAFIKELMRRSAQFALERGPDSKLTNFDVDAALDELLFSGGKLNATLLGGSGARAP